MTEYVAPAAGNRPSVAVTGAGQLAIAVGAFALSTALADADTIRLCKLPAGQVPVDFILDTDVALTVDVGIEDVDGDTSDLDAILDGKELTAGSVEHSIGFSGRRLAPVEYDRYITVTIVSGDAATTGKLCGTLLSRVAGHDD